MYQSHRVIFEVFSIQTFLHGEVGTKPNPQSGEPGYPLSSESSPLTPPPWEALPLAMLPLAQLSGFNVTCSGYYSQPCLGSSFTSTEDGTECAMPHVG